MKSRNSAKIDLSPTKTVDVVLCRFSSLSTLEREVFCPKMKRAVVVNYATTALNISKEKIEAGTYHDRGSGHCLEAPQASQGQT